MSLDACQHQFEHPATDPIDLDFARAVMAGLAKAEKSIPSRYFYDERGSALFEEITALPEYYPTRTETRILADNAKCIAGDVDEASVLIEFGSGSSVKTELLLKAIPHLHAYVPIDISPTALSDAKTRLTECFPKLLVVPIVADFSKPITLNPELGDLPRIGFFPGSTIGNLSSSDAVALLTRMRELLGNTGRLIIGVDLVKDEDTLVAAYSDAAGVTAEFNFNLLDRINRELGANFDVAAFDHKAIYNNQAGRMESYLVSKTQQSATLFGRTFDFKHGEAIHTENSYKYDLAGFASLAQKAGWSTRRVWTDADDLFSVHELTAD
ncbi:MAG: L-histidine N(alpha)-methyltransferase [Hyphomicrobiaceae bacterium]